MCYYYDKTFLGFLSLVYEIFKIKTWDVIILSQKENCLFQGNVLETNQENAGKVYNKLVMTIGIENVRKIYNAFLSEEKEVELLLLKYIRLGLKQGKKISKYPSSEVLKVEKLSRRASFEAHRFKGLLRFRKMIDNTFLAVINPTNDILPLISSHFIDRFSDQNFVIYDENRKRAIIYNCETKEVLFKDIFDFDKRLLDMKNFELLHKEEKEYITLWKKYFNTISIEERKNERCQKNFMPVKYWKNLVEID